MDGLHARARASELLNRSNTAGSSGLKEKIRNLRIAQVDQVEQKNQNRPL